MNDLNKSISQVKQDGYTLVELIMGLGIGVFLLGSGLYIYSALMGSFYSLISSNRLEQQLRSAMNSMAHNIRRAGYSASAITNLSMGSNTNPFMTTSTDLSVPSSSCILFSYDTDLTGTLSALNTSGGDERFGFRLSGTTLQARASTDSGFSCTSGTWVDITDSRLVQITNLSFTLTPTSITLNTLGNKLIIRTVTITLTGRLTNDTTVTQTITQVVRVRNDKFSAS